MAVRLRRQAAEGVGSVEASIEEWPYLDEAVLLKTRSRKVCMTCHSSATTPAPTASRCSPASCSRA